MIHMGISRVEVGLLKINRTRPRLRQAIASRIDETRIDEELGIVHVSFPIGIRRIGSVVVHPTAVGMNDRFFAVEVQATTLNKAPYVCVCGRRMGRTAAILNTDVSHVKHTT